MTAFEALFVPGRVREAIVGQSWLDSMLRVEQALADAGARAGIVLDARSLLADSRRRAQLVQLGGAAGTLAALGDRGLQVVELLAAELDLDTPTIPWHTNRVPVAGLGASLSILAGICGKIGLDVALLAQTEVGEVRPGSGGASSTMPQKQNPVAALMARACAQLAAGHASVLQASLVQEHQRAAGGWHAEWEALCGVLGHAGGAVAAAVELLRGLVVDSGRMLVNLRSGGGLVVSERIAARLTDEVGRAPAHELLTGAATSMSLLGDALRNDPRVPLTDDELDDLLDPTRYLGAAELLVDRALARYETEMGGDP